VKFTVPIANYPAAGALTVERPQGALPCAASPVRAEVSGSIDGVTFVPLGSTCETAAFDLGAFPWIAYLRIRDVTDPSDPTFGSSAPKGFDLRSVSGPGCLKYSHGAITPSPDPALTDAVSAYALSLSHLGGDLLFEKPASFEEYGNGSARLLGSAYRVGDTSTRFDVVISFAGRVQSPPPLSPVLELKPSAYTSQGGPIDPSSWYYYKQIRGVVTSKGPQSGETISLGTTSRALQVGEGANGEERTLGARGEVSYDTAGTPGTAEIAFALTACSTPPPSTMPEPTPTPAGEAPRCQSEDISNTLAFLDNNLRSQAATITRATRLLLQLRRSKANVRFATEARATVHNLYTLAWSDVWRQDRVILSCSPSTVCFDLHLEPSQAALASSARALDSAVARSLLLIQRKVPTRTGRKTIAELISKHTVQRERFLVKLDSLPAHSTRCH
jgi:hypothetical protein